MKLFFANLIAKLVYRIVYTRDPDFVIGPKEDPYMLRWWAIPRNRLFNIYLHQIRHDDDDRALHDHPWSSLSLCVSGELIEHYKSPDGVYPRKRNIKAGDWTYRGPEFAHRLAIDPLRKNKDEIFTVFMTGPRIREWGFLCPQGWRHWKDFVSQENKGEEGVGCGEVEETTNGKLNMFHCKRCGDAELIVHKMNPYCRNCNDERNQPGPM